MNNISSTRSTMRSTASESQSIVKGTSVIKSYLNSKSVFFSAISGFSISRMAVILIHAIITLLLAAAFIAEHSFLLAMICATSAAYLVRVLNDRKEARNDE